jgi:hypothetical protein
MRFWANAQETKTSAAVGSVPIPGIGAFIAVTCQLALLPTLFTALQNPAFGQTPTGVINTVIGGNNGDGLAATNAIIDPQGIEARGQHLYISDTSNNRIRKVDGITGIITTVAGAGPSGSSGDGGSALNATLGAPKDVTFDAVGNMYIAEQFNRRIRRVDLAGNIQTVAGNGNLTYEGGNRATVMPSTYGIACDTVGNLYIADFSNRRVRKVSPQGIITTVAGTGMSGYSGDNGPASQATLSTASDVWVGPNNNLYIADYQTSVIRKVDSTGIIDTVAGNGLRGFFGDGGLASLARLNLPYSVTTDTIGNLLILDGVNYRVRRVDASSQIINTIAGNGTNANAGDGGPATSASIYSPFGLTADALGNVYVSSRAATADAWSKDDRVRKISPSGTISLVAGISNNGDGGPASRAIIDPYAIRFGKGAFANDLYIADRRNNQIRRVSGATGVITTIAGNGSVGFSGDNGQAINATLTVPRGVTSDASGNVWIVDTDINRVRKVDTNGVIRTVAGNGNTGYSGEGTATTNSLYFPYAADVDAAGNLYIADRFNNRIRKVTPQGIISTIAGNGTLASTGNDGPASQASVGSPTDVRVAPDGSIYIAEAMTHQVRKITPSGTIVRVAGTGNPAQRDQGLALNAADQPWVLTLDSSGNLFIGEQTNLRVRRVDAVTGIITTVAGNGSLGSLGDGGSATAAQLRAPTGLAADSDGDVLIAQSDSFGIRKIVFDSVPNTPTPASATSTPTIQANTPTFPRAHNHANTHSGQHTDLDMDTHADTGAHTNGRRCRPPTWRAQYPPDAKRHTDSNTDANLDPLADVLSDGNQHQHRYVHSHSDDPATEHVDSNSNANCNTLSNTDSDPHVDLHANPTADSNTDANRDTISYANSDALSDLYANQHADSNTDANLDTVRDADDDAHQHPDAHANVHANQHADANIHSHLNRKLNTDTDTHPYPATDHDIHSNRDPEQHPIQDGDARTDRNAAPHTNGDGDIARTDTNDCRNGDRCDHPQLYRCSDRGGRGRSRPGQRRDDLNANWTNRNLLSARDGSTDLGDHTLPRWPAGKRDRHERCGSGAQCRSRSGRAQ